MAPQMDVSSLYMPLEFVNDNFALAYVRDTEARLLSLHASNRYHLFFVHHTSHRTSEHELT